MNQPPASTTPPEENADDATARGSWVVRWARIVLRLVDEKARRRPSPRVERILLVVSFVAFVILAVLAIKNFPDVGTGIRWEILLAAGILGQCASLVFNAGEFAVTARFVGQRVPMHRAMRVTIIGSAANLLPLPGGALVRVQALAADGARYRHSLTAAAAIGVTSVGSTFIVVGVANTGTAGTWTVLGLIALGIVVIAIAAAMLRTAAPSSRRAGRYSLYFVVVEAGYAIMASFRMWGIFQGLGVHVSLPAAFALSGVGSIATAASFFPGELGIKEAIVGLVSPLVGVPVAVGVTGAVVTRLFGFAILAVAASTLVVGDFVRRSRHGGAGTGTTPPDAEQLPPIPEIDTELR
jgi:uncharacterized membrane protein YbhN (UPF0104 family)